MYSETVQQNFNPKMLVLDMDNTILEGRFIDTAAECLGFTRQLACIREELADSVTRTKLIAGLLTGVKEEEIVAIIKSIAVITDAKKVIAVFKQHGYITGIISDSYDCVTEYVRNLLGLDFSLSNKLEISAGVVTGQVVIPEYFWNTNGNLCGHNICKSYALRHIAKEYNLNMVNIIAVGDSENDICMVRYAGMGVAFCTHTKILAETADRQIHTKSFRDLLDFAQLNIE